MAHPASVRGPSAGFPVGDDGEVEAVSGCWLVAIGAVWVAVDIKVKLFLFPCLSVLGSANAWSPDPVPAGVGGAFVAAKMQNYENRANRVCKSTVLGFRGRPGVAGYGRRRLRFQSHCGGSPNSRLRTNGPASGRRNARRTISCGLKTSLRPPRGRGPAAERCPVQGRRLQSCRLQGC
jgi:hypothetical protein